MSTFHRFTDIEAWQKARELTFEIYRVIHVPVGTTPRMKMSTLGYYNETLFEAIFIRVSNTGSFSKDLGLRRQIRDASVSVMSNIAVALAEETSRKIGALMNYLRRSGIKGLKFR